jgi:hypothetical protein
VLFTTYVLILFSFLCWFRYQLQGHHAETSTRFPTQSSSDRVRAIDSSALSDIDSRVLQSDVESMDESGTDQPADFSTMTIRQLKKECSARHIRGYSYMTKARLIEQLSNV